MEDESGNGQVKNEIALIKLVNLCFDTKTGIEGLVDEKIAELTDIPDRLITHLATQMMKETALNPYRIEKKIRLTKVWRVCYFMLRRSRGRRQLMTGIGLAESEVAGRAEEESEAWEM